MNIRSIFLLMSFICSPLNAMMSYYPSVAPHLQSPQSLHASPQGILRLSSAQESLPHSPCTPAPLGSPSVAVALTPQGQRSVNVTMRRDTAINIYPENQDVSDRLNELIAQDKKEEVACTPWNKKDRRLKRLFRFDPRVLKELSPHLKAVSPHFSQSSSQEGSDTPGRDRVNHTLTIGCVLQAFINGNAYVCMMRDDLTPRLNIIARVEKMSYSTAVRRPELLDSHGWLSLSFVWKEQCHEWVCIHYFIHRHHPATVIHRAYDCMVPTYFLEPLPLALDIDAYGRLLFSYEPAQWDAMVSILQERITAMYQGILSR